MAGLTIADIRNTAVSIRAEIYLAAERVKYGHAGVLYLNERLQRELAAYVESRNSYSDTQALFTTVANPRKGFSANTMTQHFHYLYKRTGIAGGSSHRWADMDLQVHAAPGHDPHSVILFAPEHRLLMSADALWQNGFGVVFPVLVGMNAFDEVAQTLDLIERLNPATINPGHGAVFTEVAPALTLARNTLESFAKNPEKHARYGAKVLLKFKLLEWGQISRADFDAWSTQVPYLGDLHERFGMGHDRKTWRDMMLAELERSGAMQVQEGVLIDI